MNFEKDLRKLSHKELWENHIYYIEQARSSSSQTGIPKFAFLANAYLAEIQRRENEKTNSAMKKWTIAIGIMTAVILWATLVGANIICSGG